MHGIVRIPKACDDTVKEIADRTSGKLGAEAQAAEVSFARQMLAATPLKIGSGTVGEMTALAGEQAFEKIASDAAKSVVLHRTNGPFSSTGAVGSIKGVRGAAAGAASGLIIGAAVDYGVDAIKNKANLHAKNQNAGAIALEASATTLATTGITTAIMFAAGASFNPIVAGVGFLIAGGFAAGEAIGDASKDTSLVFLAHFDHHPRVTRDFNGLSNKVFQFRNPTADVAGETSVAHWQPCSDLNERCHFEGVRTVRFGTETDYHEAAYLDGVDCNAAVAAGGKTFAPGAKLSCTVERLNWDLQAFLYIRSHNDPPDYPIMPAAGPRTEASFR
jgi:hypothetical protein